MFVSSLSAALVPSILYVHLLFSCMYAQNISIWKAKIKALLPNFLFLLFKNMFYNLKLTQRQEYLYCDMPVWKGLRINIVKISKNFAKVCAVRDMSHFEACKLLQGLQTNK